jgi:membrane-bound inhibitor of C-type lysozyme
MRAWREGAAAALALLAVTVGAHAADQLAVDVINESEPTLCAEKDNVYLKLQSQEARRFTVEAVHPAYVGTIVADRSQPDFTRCDMSNDPVFRFQRRQVTLYESAEWRLVGHTFDSFWRPNQVPVKVGDRVENGLHLLQLWTWTDGRADEVLVLYPADGYWRARPKPAANLRSSVYGSSFLIGPVETEGRPIVDIRDVAYEPESKTFTLNFVRGGRATLRVERLDDERIVLDVNLSQSAGAQRPFAALRSMFVSEGNADVARIGWRAKDGQRWLQEPVLEFKRATAAELWAGRLVPSRHNTSAPDTVFRDFSATAK